MSGGFGEREKGFENKWAHDEELRFKVYARRNKLLGVWAAGEMGIAGEAADAYAKEVVAADFEKPGDDDVVEKIMADFKLKGVAITEHRVRKELADQLDTARRQIMSEVRED